jgi:peroxiredoxin
MRLSDLKGKVVVLNFWASWCPPCRWEMLSFENIWREYRSQGVVFVGIAEDFEEEEARAFAEKVGITYPVGLDTKGRFARHFQVFQLPTTFLLDREGNQAKKIANVANEGVLKVFLRGLLNDP